MSKVAEILKMVWRPRGRVTKPEPTPAVYPKIEFSEEQAAINIQRLRSSFENKQAILIEKGALLVRISNISASMLKARVTMDVEEVITPGLGVGMFAQKSQKGRKPYYWHFGAGDLSCFRDTYWATGYGGWSLYSDPKLIEEVLQLATSFPPEVNTFERYSRIVWFIHEHELTKGKCARLVFPPISDDGPSPSPG